MTTYGAWLRNLGEQRLAEVLRLRPDACAPPHPADFAALAGRLSDRSSVLHALSTLDVRGLELAELLQALGLRSFAPSVTACPGCGRTTSTTFQELAERTQDYIRSQMPEWKKRYEGVETLTLAVMGCVVNGPGESKAANIGISLPGTGEAPNCPVFIDGEHFTTLRGTYDELAEGFRALVDNYVATRYAARS